MEWPRPGGCAVRESPAQGRGGGCRSCPPRVLLDGRQKYGGEQKFVQPQMRNGGDSGGPWGSRTRRAGEPESRDACGAAVWEKRRSLESRRADGTTPLTPVRLVGGCVYRTTLCRTRRAGRGPKKSI